MKIAMVPLDRMVDDPNNPRKEVPAEQMEAMIASIRLHGIKVPLICYMVANGVMPVDGNCRLAAARKLGLTEVPAVILPQKPDESELLLTQLTINGVRHALNPVDEYEAFARLAKLKNWNASELAAGMAVSNAEVTRVLAIGKLSKEEQQLVREGKIAKSAAYALARMNPEQRATSVRKAASGELSRDELNAQARKKCKAEIAKTQRVNCSLAGGTVSLQSSAGLNLGNVIDLLEELLRECRKARTQGLDATTFARVLRDRSRVQAGATEGATS